ncbi:InlB B-repeat-containing protein [Bifidobacterium samirii]|uniref:Listeria-Bacteroides repeat domain n=1 Tax=Bifidobacterium samirii TaxID=2306974 RepID=A0A430FRE6_9BIFI|nr:InlB B-repeat-containing protein [Bifidobacterium samirii]RSX55406.1 Listeria-Bacteroides repeat domain [Bifidobacterium samirii]
MAFKKKIVGGVVAAAMLAAVVPAATALATDAAKYKVNFCLDTDNTNCIALEGNATDSFSNIWGEAAEFAAKNAADGQTLAGWYYYGSGTLINATDPIADGVTVYAKYEAAETPAAKYTVTFRLDADDESGASDVKATGESTASFADVWDEANAAAAAKAAADGKEFVGWYYYGSGTLINATDPIADGVTVNAKYETAETPAAEYTFHFVNEDNSTIKDVTLENTESGLSFWDFSKDVTAPTVKGKKFVGWANVAGDRINATDTFTGAGEAWAYPVYEAETPAAKEHTVTFYMGADDETGTPVKASGSFMNFSAKVTAPAVEGKKFVGWAATGSTDVIADDTEVTGNWYVTPIYEDAPAKVVYYTVSFLNADGNVFATTSYDAGRKFGEWAQPAPEVEGKVFAGWVNAETGEAIDPDMAVTSDLQVVATYKDAPAETVWHTVYFHDINDELFATTSYDDGRAFGEWAQPAPAVEGKVFAGWKYATGEDVDADTPIKGDIHVYATYKDAPAETVWHQVSFYDGDDTLIATVTYDDGRAFGEWAQQAPAVEGKVFVGWKYATGETVDPTMPVKGDIHVYAAYEDAPVEEDKTENVVSFYDADQNLIQTVGYYAKDKVAFSTYAAGIQAPAVEGKVFTGWGFASNEGDVAVDVDAVVTGNWAVYAMYEDAPAEDDTTQNVVSFYDADQNLIQTVGYYAKDQVKFSQYALGIQAPAVEGKVFTGWGFASNEGDVPVNVDDVVTGDWAVYAMYTDAPAEDDTTQNVVSFYDADQNLIQTVGYYAKDQVKFSQYALGIQAPAIEGKVFTGWGFASNEGDVPVDVDSVVTGDWAVYAMYEDAPAKEDPKDDTKKADTKADETKTDTKAEQKTAKKAAKKLSSTGAAVVSVAVMAVIALAGGAAVLTMRKRA